MPFAAERTAFAAELQQHGVPAALRYLTGRTPHRYTGVFQFDGQTLGNVALYDRPEPAVQRGEDVPLAVTYCALVGQQQAPLEILDAATDPAAQGVETPVVSYFGGAAAAGSERTRQAPDRRKATFAAGEPAILAFDRLAQSIANAHEMGTY